jgi:hypothetical protein
MQTFLNYKTIVPKIQKKKDKKKKHQNFDDNIINIVEKISTK